MMNTQVYNKRGGIHLGFSKAMSSRSELRRRALPLNTLEFISIFSYVTIQYLFLLIIITMFSWNHAEGVLVVEAAVPRARDAALGLLLAVRQLL